MSKHEVSDSQTQTATLAEMEARIKILESKGETSAFKRLTDDAGAVALVLGLILSFASLYDVIIAKPKADRISAISQFNQAVNAVAKLQEDLVLLQAQQKDPQTRLSISTSMTPQVLNDVATARALLPELRESDVGIPQLIVLIYEALAFRDFQSAGDFVSRAARKTDVTPYLRAEEKRYEARYLFMTGKPAGAREAFQSGLNALGETPETATERAFVLGDWTLLEFTLGDCTVGTTALHQFSAEVRGPGIVPDAHEQLVATVEQGITQLGGTRCPAPTDLASLFGH